MKQKNSFNWPIDNIGAEQKQTPEEKQKELMLNDSFWNCFNSDFGKKVIEYLISKYESPRSHYPELGQDGVLYTYTRGGQVSVVRDILARIKKSEEQRRKADDGKSQHART